MRYVFIRAEKANYPVCVLCRVLEVSRSGFYAWLKRTPSRRARRDAALGVEIRAVWKEHHRRYGSPRVWRELTNQGHRVGRKRVERLMRENGLRARPKRRYVVTTDSEHRLQRFDNVLDRAFAVQAQNDVWAADITYIRVSTGWLYLAVILDLFSRRVVGWSLGDSINTELTLSALRMALGRRPPPRLHHSDQGSQYAAWAYQRVLSDHGIAPSMSRRGNCWDNAPVESFFSSLKAELDASPDWRPNEARTKIFEYIECYYNRRRLHSSIGYQSPEEYERAAA